MPWAVNLPARNADKSSQIASSFGAQLPDWMLLTAVSVRSAIQASAIASDQSASFARDCTVKPVSGLGSTGGTISVVGIGAMIILDAEATVGFDFRQPVPPRAAGPRCALRQDRDWENSLEWFRRR